MDEAAVAAGPIGRNVLVQGLEFAEDGDSFSCSSEHRGRRPRRATPKPQGPRPLPIPSPGERTLRS
eukprot:15283447-Alexandrium_andersonii.AAC.1